MTVEFFSFAGCPSATQALANLRTALTAEHLPDTFEIVEVRSPAEAQSCRFIGSPTIRIDGVDLEGPEAEARGYGFGCRVYMDGGKTHGWPTVDQIRKALRRHSPPRRT
jgi:hypothetical protein